jgi:LCP family protein required for cell wall assembly
MKKKRRSGRRSLSKGQAMKHQDRPNRSEMPNGEQVVSAPETKAEPVQNISRLPRKRSKSKFWLKLIAFLLVISLVYLFFPSTTDILILGIDRSHEGTVIGRSDSIIYAQVKPASSDVNLLSVPRDLWVEIPGYGAERINTAHYFAEADEEGSGPALAISTFESNFDLDVDYYVRIQLEKFPAIIDAFGGLNLTLEESMGGLMAGEHHLSGDETLIFIRDRAGTDDFFRMEQGQKFIRTLIQNLATPGKWLRIPAAASAFFDAVETDIPQWKWGRIAMTFLFAGEEGLTSYKIDRDMTIPIVTDQGANVLMPDWLQIVPWIEENFK